ncbi:DNA primase [Treponema sp.]
MSRITEQSIQELNNRADALTLVGEYVRLEKKGGRYWGLCPFHNEKTPSFSVEPDRKFFYCFGCGKGGGLVNFVMELEKISFPEAIELLAKKVGLELVYEGGGAEKKDEGERNESLRRLEQQAELNERVAGSFRYFLTNTEAGSFTREYLKERGVSDEIAEKFRLGYAPADRSWLFNFLTTKGYSEGFLAQTGLFSKKNPRSAFFADRLIFPIADRQGRTVAFGARLLHGEGPKCPVISATNLNFGRRSENLFALDLALAQMRKTKEAYICEGYMDVMALHQAGIINAVAPLGTSFTEEQAKLLRRWVEKVYLVFDSDTAGINAAVKGVITCRKLALSCSVLTITEGKDPADILRDSGVQALQKAMKCFINDFDYLVDRARSRFDMHDTEGLAQAVAFLFPYLETLDSEVSRNACVGAIADAFGVERLAVQSDFSKRQAGQRPERSSDLGKAKSAIKLNDELFLLMAVLVNRGLYPRLRSELSPEDIDDSRAKELFVALEECFRNEADDLDSLISRIKDEELISFVLARVASDAFTENAERLVSDGITRVKKRDLEKRRASILLQLRSAQREGDKTLNHDDLLSEKMHIDAELKRLKDVHE